MSDPTPTAADRSAAAAERAADAGTLVASAAAESLRVLSDEVRELRESIEKAWRATRWRLAAAIASIAALIGVLSIAGVVMYNANSRTQDTLAQLRAENAANNAKFCALTRTIATFPANTSGGVALRGDAQRLYTDLGCGILP